MAETLNQYQIPEVGSRIFDADISSKYLQEEKFIIKEIHCSQFQ